MRKLAVLACALGLASCATPYQDMGFTGGVHATRLTDDTAIISARGNAYTDPDTIQMYALRRAAEETLADGFDGFVIVDAADRTRTGASSFGGASASGNSVFGSSLVMPVIKPGDTLTIKMMHGPAPDPKPPGYFDAHELEAHLAPHPYQAKP